MNSTAYVPRNIKRKARRSKLQMEVIEISLVELLRKEHPMTCRQAFYRLVSLGVIDKTEQEYKGTVIRLLGQLRRQRRVPFNWIADNTRWVRGPTTYTGLHSVLHRTAENYRRALWDDQDAYVEVWCEKDALAGVIIDVTDPWDVPLMVSRGFASISFLHAAAEQLLAVKKPAFIYYFGDRDPSGVVIDKTIERELRQYAPGTDITFKRVAVTEEQIDELNLPTRPTKTTDSRCKGFKGESVDLDAVPPAELRHMVQSCIEGHIDVRQLRITQQVEAEEREALRLLAARVEEDQS